MVEDDQHAISVAKTEYREAHNNGDVQRLLSVFAPGFTDWSDGEPSFYGQESRRALELRATELFNRFKVELFVIIIDIVVKDNLAFDWGWHKLRLVDKRTGATSDTKYRYFERWVKTDGAWKINYIITNKEMPPKMLPEQESESTRVAAAGKAVP
jgi:ketosteroid isomerase-like protein